MKYLLTIITAICVSLAIPKNLLALPLLRVGLVSSDKGLRHDPVAVRINRTRQTADALERLAKRPIGRKLSRKQRKEALRYNRWLINTSRRLRRFADLWNNRLKRSPRKRLSRETLKTFNLQYLNLQQNMQHENRQFTMISNIMKTKHDTAKNAISNVR